MRDAPLSPRECEEGSPGLAPARLEDERERRSSGGETPPWIGGEGGGSMRGRLSLPRPPCTATPEEDEASPPSRRRLRHTSGLALPRPAALEGGCAYGGELEQLAVAPAAVTRLPPRASYYAVPGFA
ncbi:uncharacterized protein LJ264_000735 isoform 1-T2 [Porphyrio hochstetteri]